MDKNKSRGCIPTNRTVMHIGNIIIQQIYRKTLDDICEDSANSTMKIRI